MDLVKLIDEALDYMMSHRPAQMAPLDDLTQIMPADVYTHPHYYQTMDKAGSESFSVISKFRGRPNATVTIYRAGPRKMLNNGDWVTLSKTYAKQDSMEEMNPVHSFKVKVKDVWFAGDSLNEFGYFGPDIPEDREWLNDKLESEKKYILRTGEMPDGAALYRKFSKDYDYLNKFKNTSDAYYQYISDVLNGTIKL